MADIERINMPPADVFYRDYMCKSKPLVIADMFDGQPIRAIRARAEAIARFAEVPIMVQEEYFKAYTECSDGQPRTVSFADYYRFVDANRDTKQMALEFPTPYAIGVCYDIPEVCHPKDGESRKFVNQCFIGNSGNNAQIHFDKAGLHGFLYQVFGKKRYFWFPHHAAPKLAPMTQFGGWNLHNFSEADRKAFLEFTGGIETVIDAGDCMYVPTLSWHAVDYMEDSMSISLRFRRADRITKLVNSLFPDMYMQGIAEAMADPTDERTWGPILAEITAAAAQRNGDGVAHVRKMRALARKLHAQLYPDMPREAYLLELEAHMPDLLPHFLDADHPDRPLYT
jgi:hypothetical protein